MKEYSEMTLKELKDYSFELFCLRSKVEKKMCSRTKEFSDDIKDVYPYSHLSFTMFGGSVDIKFLEGYKHDITIRIYGTCPSNSFEELQSYITEQSRKRDEAIKVSKIVFKDWLGREAKNTNLDEDN